MSWKSVKDNADAVCGAIQKTIHTPGRSICSQSDVAVLASNLISSVPSQQLLEQQRLVHITTPVLETHSTNIQPGGQQRIDMIPGSIISNTTQQGNVHALSSQQAAVHE